MFRDSTDLNNGGLITADICIVGAGIAGIALARELMDTKAEVVVLESGTFDPDSEAQSLNSGENAGLPYFDLENARTRAFGGTSHDWHIDPDGEKNGQFVRLRALDAIDFKKRDWVPYSEWPFTKEELDPYYERAHKVFKIGPYRYDAAFWEDSTRPKMDFMDEAVDTTVFQFGRKEIFYQEYREELRHAENIKVYLNATALELRTDEYANRIRSIAATTLGGRQFDVRSQCFILAMGGLENPRLLLLSNNQIKPGIGNQHDRVGRFFMEHPHLWSGVFYPSTDSFFSESGLYNIHYRDNLPVMGKLVLSEEKMREEKILNNTVSIHFSPMQALRKPVRAIYEVKQSILRGKADESILSNLKTIFSNPDVVFNQAVKKISGTDWLANHGKKFKYSGYLLNMMSEQAPDPESRVSLSRNRDRFGQNRLELNWKMNGSDVRSIRRFQEILDGELRKNLLGHLDIELEGDTIPEKIHGGYHHMGTTRMDRDPKKGVVDENCKVHGIKNLFIAGSSVFPTTGYANPTLTIVAMAIRLAEHLKNYAGIL